MLVQAIDYQDIKQSSSEHSSAEMYVTIENALQAQEVRFGSHRFNHHMTSDEIERYCVLDQKAEQALQLAFDRLNLSMRGYHKILKIARTIADLDKSSTILLSHIQEAITYRSLEQTLEKMRATP